MDLPCWAGLLPVQLAILTANVGNYGAGGGGCAGMTNEWTVMTLEDCEKRFQGTQPSWKVHWYCPGECTKVDGGRVATFWFAVKFSKFLRDDYPIWNTWKVHQNWAMLQYFSWARAMFPVLLYFLVVIQKIWRTGVPSKAQLCRDNYSLRWEKFVWWDIVLAISFMEP